MIILEVTPDQKKQNKTTEHQKKTVDLVVEAVEDKEGVWFCEGSREFIFGPRRAGKPKQMSGRENSVKPNIQIRDGVVESSDHIY